MTLKGKVAIVTGGNSGIGKAVVLGLAAEGASIVIDYVSDPDAAEALEEQVRALGDQVVAVNADVSKIPELEKLIGAAVSNFGRLDIMVNNAGIETRTSVLDTTEDQYERVLAINLKSAFFGTQLAAKQMISQGGGGRIINMTSVHEDWPMPGNTAVLPLEGGHAHADPDGRRGVGSPQCARRRGRPGRGRYPHQHRHRQRSCRSQEARRRHSDRPAWPSRRRSPAWWCSLPATAPAT